jgi:hypothetical protein
MLRFAPLSGAAAVTMLMLASVTAAGVVNPNISVVGQPSTVWTDAAGDPAAKRVSLDPGETEFVFDDYLNPYARGIFVVSLSEEGAEVEEGYFTLLRGLPAGLALKGGKYRVGFGKLNPQHPHAVPFAEPFRVLKYLPGDEAFNETGFQLSARLPTAGDWAITASGDVLKGDTFRLERPDSGAPNDPYLADGDRSEEPRPAVVGRVSAFGQIGDRSGIELGVSATKGTNNVAAATRTTVIGGDVKLKYWTSPNAYVVVQGEGLHLKREDAGWDEVAAAYTKDAVKKNGGYLYADYNFKIRYNLGASFERYQDPDVDVWNQAIGVFAGLALMEETTAFRLDWNHLAPGTAAGVSPSPDAVNTVTLRIIYSMGPHKAHQF